MANPPLHTPLYDWHAAHRGRLVDFAGWSMPVQYGSIVDEHLAVRRAAGIFDVSHMGRLRFDGPQAVVLLDRLLTRRVIGLGPGKVRYALVTNPAGGILDDVLVYHLERPGAEDYFQLVVNASNRARIVEWIQPHLDSVGDVVMTDLTTSTAMIAVQGPQALGLVQPLIATDLRRLAYYAAVVTAIGDVEGVVSRTGYTGEDGCELMLPASLAVGVWEQLVAAGAVPVGLGARDTLRLEAAMPLYGHELSESIDPYQAGLAFAVNLEGRTFVGHDALQRLSQQPPARQRVGLALSGKRVPREQYTVLSAGRPVGQVTSGTFSPTLQRPIAMAYVERDHAQAGETVTVDIRGQGEPAVVVNLPFYARSR
ncbi:MAG: glycine cleavage system aminomethyltransferase GcvT [Pirellulales bacterium]